ncbi:putative C-mannosyltransferase DPY19L1 isoform X1 [Vespula maculifrons]|uniref:C-mannosyltransferase DPY19L1 isoform X1 n=1 Tax=Vespula maculifrons TaxID=7453 RepID=A0ABD2BL76_VESMC
MQKMAATNDSKSKSGRKLMKESIDFYHLAVHFLSIAFGFLHRWHVSTLFENDRHFSHLSEMEREMSFKTEMGMYYSYYKTIVEAKTFADGVSKLGKDNISEHGNVINAYRKYNLLPEIIASYLYHSIKNLGLIPKGECWETERGHGLSSVTSCIGLDVPIYFYLEMVWITTIYTAAILFKYSTYMSNSVFGGFITMLLFFYNHNECTRVQWTPPLRETFAYPMLLFQMYSVTKIIEKYATEDIQKVKRWRILTDGLYMNMLLGTVSSLCSWQLSHFILTTQIVALLILKWVEIIPKTLFLSLSRMYTISSILSMIIIDGTFLLHSLFSCILIGSNFAEAIVRYKDFHTMLYTCSPEFDFLQYKTYEAIIKTLLLPIAILSGILALYYWYREYENEGYPYCIEPSVCYNGLQTGAFIIMAGFVMRLKLFMTPHLCIIAGLVCNKRYSEKLGLRSKAMKGAVLILLIAGMSYHGMERLQEERGLIGEYSDIEQEELFEWIKENTPQNAVFAGKMSLMANLMLSTGRPIVNNPYYESAEMRNRTMRVYEIFSRKDAASVYVTLRNMDVGYVVLEEPLCLGYANVPQGCQMIDLWDMVDSGTAKTKGKLPLCPLLFEGNAYPFRRAFMNNHYVVLQLVYSHYFEYNPKTSMPLQYQF